MRLLAVTAAVLAFPASAWAAEGSTTIDLGGRAFERLRAQDVRVVAKRPARLARGVLRLPVRQGLVGSAAYLNHSGSLTFKRGRRVVRVVRLQSRLGTRSYLNGTVRGRRIRLFTLAGGASLNPTTGTASLRDGRLTLTRTAARAIRRGLKLRRLPAGVFGSATVDALVQAANPVPGGPGPGDGPPQSGPPTGAPPVLARPATAVDLASGIVTWHVRDSWVRYVSTDEEAQALEGAVPGPHVTQDQHPCPDAPTGAAPPPLVYSYTLPFANGWHDPASGHTAVYTTGGVRFSYPGHGIDLTIRNLEIELTGASARVIARFPDERGVLVNLAAPVGGTHKGSIPTGGSESVFGGFYAPGVGFGCVTVSSSP